MKKMRNRLILIPVMFVLISFLVSCTNDIKQDTSASPSASEASQTKNNGSEKTFSLDELKKNDGQNGNPAYVAVDGVVYDVTNVKAWSNGKHNGYEPGNDLTDVINKSPHGKAVLKDVPVVGKLVK